MQKRRFLAGLLVVTALGGVACSDGNDDDDGAATATTTTTEDDDAAGTTTTSAGGATTTTGSASPTPTEPAQDLPDAQDSGKSELADGRHFGYWKTFEVGDTTAFGEFDLAYFLTGEEAEKAAQEADEEVTNDYYIVNNNPKLRTLIVAGNAKVTVLEDQGGPDTASSNVADFAVDRHVTAGFWVTIADGLVIEIEEQYQP